MRQTIKRCESTEPVTKAVFGSDCAAANLVLGINKMRYKMGKGDPSGFRLFLLQKKLPLLLIPRYRGNRLHVLFHIAGVLVCHHSELITYLSTGTAVGGLRQSLLQDMKSDAIHVQLQVIGLLGKLLTGPWMNLMYR